MLDLFADAEPWQEPLAAGAVILVQQKTRGIGIVPLKPQHDLRLGTSEPVDGLVIIPHYEQVILRLSQHSHDLILDPVNILKLIN